MAKLRFEWSEVIEASYSQVFDSADLEAAGIDLSGLTAGEVYGKLDNFLASKQETAERIYEATTNREINTVQRIS